MLATQVQYLNFLEQRRHNENTELEQWRSNRASEMLKLREISNQAVKMSADIKQNAQKLANERWNIERQYEVNALNAATNRMNAINQQRRNFQDWNLSLQANRIAERNAQANWLNAQSKETEAIAKALTAEVGQQRLYLDSGVNWMNAETNRRNTQLRERELNMMREHYMWSDTAAMINSTANVANAIFRGVSTYPQIANTAYFMGRI